MRFLLVAISILFSGIFFLFYTASIWRNIFLISNNNFFFWSSIFEKLWVTPIIFLLLAVFYFIYFKHENINTSQEHNTNTTENKWDKKISNIIISIGIYLLSIGILFSILQIDVFLLFIYYFWWILIFFLFQELFIKKLIPYKVFLVSNIYSIISGYLASIWWIIYIIFIKENLFILSILMIIWFYHIYIHLKFDNIISFIFWIITFIYPLYRWIGILFPWII